MHFVAADRQSVEKGIFCQPPYIVISIRNPGRTKPCIKRASGLIDVLYLSFHDAEPTPGFKLPPHVKLMTERQAAKIARFVNLYIGLTNGVLVHCEQGMSRSPAVAAAIAHSVSEDVDELIAETHPNPYVYKLLSEVLQKLKAKTNQKVSRRGKGQVRRRPVSEGSPP